MKVNLRAGQSQPSLAARGAAQLRALWPLCRQSLRASGRRNLSIIALVALSLVFYSLYVSFLDVTYRESAKLIRPVRLPPATDIVLYVPHGVSTTDRQALQTLYYLDDRAWAVAGQVATNLGSLTAMFVAETAPAQIPGTITAGDPPTAGQCLLPAELAATTGALIGGRLSLTPLAGPGAPGPVSPPPAVTIAGVYQPCDPWFAMPYVVLDQAAYDALGPPTMALLTVHPSGNYLARTIAWLNQRLVPGELRTPYVAQRAELPLVLTSATAHEWARQLQRAMYFPGGEAMFLLYIFFGVGVFTLMLLSFLERRREMAVMKTLGLTSGQVAALLYMEVLSVAAVGLVAGGVLLAAGLPSLRQLTGQDLRLSAWIWASGAMFSLVALLLSVWLPIAMAKLATVANLLGGQPFHLAGYERRWAAAPGDDSPDPGGRRRDR